MTKYDEQFKLSVVQSYEQGTDGLISVAHRYGLDHAMIRRWVQAYQHHGLEGLRKKFSHYDAEFKLSILRRMQQERLSATQTIALFNIRGGSSVITDWQRRYHEQGLAGLQPKPRGRPKKMPVPESPKPTNPMPDIAKLSGKDVPLLHSDQGWQYQMVAYQRQLAAHGLIQSMSRKGNCLDNAAMESFFGTLKSEFFYLNRFENVEQLQAGIRQYIHYYNHERIRTKLKGLSPVQYRNQALAA